jgi:hypothetical protein
MLASKHSPCHSPDAYREGDTLRLVVSCVRPWDAKAQTKGLSNFSARHRSNCRAAARSYPTLQHCAMLALLPPACAPTACALGARFCTLQLRANRRRHAAARALACSVQPSCHKCSPALTLWCGCAGARSTHRSAAMRRPSRAAGSAATRCDARAQLQQTRSASCTAQAASAGTALLAAALPATAASEGAAHGLLDASSALFYALWAGSASLSGARCAAWTLRAAAAYRSLK